MGGMAINFRGVAKGVGLDARGSLSEVRLLYLKDTLTARLLFYYHLRTLLFFIFLCAQSSFVRSHVAKIVVCNWNQEIFT